MSPKITNTKIAGYAKIILIKFQFYVFLSPYMYTQLPFIGHFIEEIVLQQQASGGGNVPNASVFQIQNFSYIGAL